MINSILLLLVTTVVIILIYIYWYINTTPIRMANLNIYMATHVKCTHFLKYTRTINKTDTQGIFIRNKYSTIITRRKNRPRFDVQLHWASKNDRYILRFTQNLKPINFLCLHIKTTSLLFETYSSGCETSGSYFPPRPAVFGVLSLEFMGTPMV